MASNGRKECEGGCPEQQLESKWCRNQQKKDFSACQITQQRSCSCRKDVGLVATIATASVVNEQGGHLPT